MLKGRKKKNHGFRMMEREGKAIRRKAQLKTGKAKCSKRCIAILVYYSTHNVCNTCAMAKKSPYLSKAKKYMYFRNKRARLKMYWGGVELGMIDEHCYDYWLGKRDEE
jgi:hypothetical protein